MSFYAYQCEYLILELLLCPNFYFKVILQWNALIRAKWSVIYCWFFYTCFPFSCILLQFYVCFSVLGQFWKKIEERKTCKFGKFLHSKAKLSRSVDQGRSTGVGNELAPRRQQSRKCQKTSFFSFAEIGNLADLVPDPFGYLRTSKTHPQLIKNHT